MKKANLDIRAAAAESGIMLWQIAARYGINDGNFTRLLRKELPPEKKDRIFAIIDDIKAEKGATDNDR